MAEDGFTTTADEAVAAIERLKSVEMPEYIRQLINSVASEAEGELARNVPVKSGGLKSSIRNMTRRGVRFVGTTNEYGAYVARGVEAGKLNPILPRNKRALYWAGAAHPVAYVLNHPGIRANPYDKITEHRIKSRIPSLALALALQTLSGVP